MNRIPQVYVNNKIMLRLPMYNDHIQNLFQMLVSPMTLKISSKILYGRLGIFKESTSFASTNWLTHPGHLLQGGLPYYYPRELN